MFRSLDVDLQHTALLELVVGDHSQDTGGHLCDDVCSSAVRGDPAIVQEHGSHRRVEMAATDAAAQERENREGRANRPGVSRGNDDGQKDKGSKEFYENGQRVHLSSTLGA